MVWVTKAEHVEGFKLLVTFNDGVAGIVDLRGLIFNDTRDVLRQLRNEECFRRFKVALDTVVWENGLDLAPEYLRSLAVTDVKPSKTAAV
jgi:hypothetical protein